MVAVNSIMLPTGTKLPSFKLRDAYGAEVSGHAMTGEGGILVAFLSNHCPYVKHIQKTFATLADTLTTLKLGVVAINSNDATAYPDDSPEHMKQQIEINAFHFPYLVDSEQTVAKVFKAMCTPDFFLFDKELRLFYRGQMDSSRPKNDIAPSGDSILNAAIKMTQHEGPPAEQRPSIGCNIKWKPGNEPDYYLKHISGEF